MIYIIRTTLPFTMKEFEVTSFAQSLIEAGSACVQHHQIASTFSWEGNITHEKEWSLSIKVSSQNLLAVTEVIKNLHPYDVPQILTQEIQSNKEYEDWVNSKNV